MKRMLVGLAALMLVIGTNALGGDTKKDTEKLQGKWTVTAFGFGGKKKDLPPGSATFIFSKNKMTITSAKGNEEGTYKIDATKKPKHFEATTKKDGKEETKQAIYDLQGDNLKLGFAKEGRPTGFDAEGVFTIFLTRKK